MYKIKIIAITGVVMVFTIFVGYFFVQNQNNSELAISQKNGANKSIESETENVESDCNVQYANILAKYQQNFDDCRLDVKKAEGCDKSPNDSDSKQKNLVVIFDSSGSMAQAVGGKKKIDIAKESVAGFIKDIDKNTNLSVVLYGHKGSNSQASKKLSCAGIDEVYYMGGVNSDVAISKLSGAVPTGWTPIAGSLQKAGDILKKYPADKNDNMILLVSDGEETCDGDPVAKAKELMGADLKVVTNVIGFDVTGAAEKNLQNIAGSGGGKYFSVNNEEEFRLALKENKNFMAGFDCYMQQGDIWLGNQLETTFKEGECMRRLDIEEKHQIDLSASLLNNGITAECKNTVLSLYQKRYDEIKRTIEQSSAANKKDTESEQKKLEETRDTMDAGEGVFLPE